MSGSSIEDLVLGHVLETRRRVGGGGGGSGRIGSARTRRARALLRNAAAPRSWQSVVKRIRGGSTRTPQELKRLLDYVAREEGVRSSWCNLAGYARDLDPAETARIASTWSSTWRGAPIRGHTDHIILSFPRGVALEAAEAVARDWGQAVFGSGDYGDSWRYVAALHQDTDHLHAHFVVDKHGIDLGRFLSISRHSELSYDVMRALHAEIGQAHGLNIAASSRLSRGITENPPREVEVRAAHAAGAPPPAPPPLSDGERARRLEALQDFAEDYAALSRIAGLAARDEGEGAPVPTSYLARLSRALGAASASLMEGVPLMPDRSLHAEADPVQRLEAAQAAMRTAAREAWAEIRAMDPSPERVELERIFAAQSRESLALSPSDPFLAHHAEIVPRGEDPYHQPLLASLSRLEERGAEGASEEGPNAGYKALGAMLSHLRDEAETRLIAALSVREDDLREAGTSAAEMQARFLLPDRGAAQIAAWREQPTPEAQVLWRELERDLGAALATTLADLDLPRPLEEALAREQLLTAERHLRLSTVPALEALVDRVQETLTDEALARIRAGDLTPLQPEIRDSALRGAVAAELRNEADLASPETVGKWQDLVLSQERAATLAPDRLAERDRDAGHEL